MPPFYVVGARLLMPVGARFLIPVELGDHSCPYKVKRRSGFQIVRWHSTNISIRIRDRIFVNIFVFTTYCICESPT